MKKDATDLRIFALRKQGNTLKEIAQAVGLAPSTVRDRLLQSGKFPGRVRLRNHFPQEKVRVIFSMYKKGASLQGTAFCSWLLQNTLDPFPQRTDGCQRQSDSATAFLQPMWA
jgi:hypothetical protein